MATGEILYSISNLDILKNKSKSEIKELKFGKYRKFI
jgi:hypothetical protein